MPGEGPTENCLGSRRLFDWIGIVFTENEQQDTADHKQDTDLATAEWEVWAS